MAFELLDSAQARCRALTARHPVALVRAGARFGKGELVKRPAESGRGQHIAWRADPQVLTIPLRVG
jgi:hypothetical protein